MLYFNVLIFCTANYDDQDPVLNVVMYETESNDCINKKLISTLILESAMASLSKDTITEVFIKHIEPNGDVYVQIPSVGAEKLNNLCAELSADICDDPPPIYCKPNKRNSCDTLFFTKCKRTGCYRRATIIDWSPCEKYAQIYFVDNGHTEVMKVSESTFYLLSDLSEVITQFPPQAIKVRMIADAIPSNFVEFLSEFVTEETVVLKIIQERDGCLFGEFFTRTKPGNMLYSINKALALQSEMK